MVYPLTLAHDLVRQAVTSKPDPELSRGLRQEATAIDSGFLTRSPVCNSAMLSFLGNVISSHPHLDLRFLINLANPNLPIRVEGKPSCPAEALDLPVVGVTWFGASAFAQWVGGRLPAWHDWAYASLRHLGYVYAWGSTAPDVSRANFGHHQSGPTVPGKYPPTGLGFYDLCGNVREWCADLVPSCAGDAESRRVAGGGWSSPADDLKLDNLASKLPLMGSSSCGFRVLFASSSGPGRPVPGP